MFGRHRWTFPGGADNKKWIEFWLICLSVRPKESQGISLATALTATIFIIFPASTKVAAVGRHHKRGGAALRPRHLFCGFLCTGFE